MDTLEQREPQPGDERPEIRPPVEARPLARRLIARVRSDRSLTKKASLNAFAAGVEQGARVIVGFVFTPFLVNRLGADVYGIWQILQRLIGHASPASGRPGEALKWSVAHDQLSDDYERKRRAFGNAIAVWAIFTPLLVAIAGAVAWFAPNMIGGRFAGSPATVRVAAAILVVDAVLFAFFYLPQSILQGENLGYKRIGMSVFLIVLNKGMLVGAVFLGYGLVGMAIADMLGTVSWGLAYLYFAKQYVPWFGVARPSVREVRAFIGLSWWFLVWNLIMQAMLASDVVVLGIVASPALVTTYTLARFLPQAITLAVATLIFSVMPGLGGVVGAGDFPRAIRLREETLAFIWLFSTIAGATVLLWERTFLHLWIGQRYYPGAPTVLLIILLTLQFSMLRTDANIIDLTLNLRRKVIIGSVSAVLSVGLAWYFLGPLDMGIFGLCLGFMIGRSILSVAYPLIIGRMIGVPLGRQVRGLVRPATATAAVLAATALAGAAIQVSSWATLVLGGTLTSAAITAATFFGGLRPRSRRIVWARIRRIGRLT